MLPALTLMLLAPLIAEVLPGATRIQALFVFPFEVGVWGGGAVLIRETVRRLRLGWFNLLLLAAALSLAEEFLIQQTSFAPLVIKLKGVEYARALGVNYVYLLWALPYESLFVVFIPIGLAELIFQRRRGEGWLNATGAKAVCLYFLPASFLAWFTWTHIARTQVFHLDPYTPPLGQIVLAAATIVALIALAAGPARNWLARPARPLRPPHPAVLFILSGLAATVIYATLLLAFGILPDFPPLAAAAIELALIVAIIVLAPSWNAHPNCGIWHDVGILYGATIANMAVTFVGYMYESPLNFYGKVILDVIAVVLLLWLAMRLRQSQSPA
jgi:hypothetical protein